MRPHLDVLTECMVWSENALQVLVIRWLPPSISSWFDTNFTLIYTTAPNNRAWGPGWAIQLQVRSLGNCLPLRWKRHGNNVCFVVGVALIDSCLHACMGILQLWQPQKKTYTSRGGGGGYTVYVGRLNVWLLCNTIILHHLHALGFRCLKISYC